MARARNSLAAIGLGALLIWVNWGALSSSNASGVAPSGPVDHVSAGPVAVAATPPAHDWRTDHSVRQSRPQWIQIDPGVMARTELNPDGVRAINGAVIPKDNRPAFRTDSNLPGTDSPGTSFIVGHNYTDSNGVYVPFSVLGRAKTGDTVVLGTGTGVLHYRIDQILKVPKTELASRADLLKNVPGRLIIETCDTVNGLDTYDNLVLISQLVT